jgi:hypothetical protein
MFGASSVQAELPSPLVLSDRLLHLAEDADRAGCRLVAENLLSLAYSVFDEIAIRKLPRYRRHRIDDGA